MKIKDILSEEGKEQKISAKGWVRTRRGSKHVSFIALNDGSTINNIQIVAEGDSFNEELIKQITTGSCISVDGKLVTSKGSGQAVEILADKIEVLGAADAEEYPLQPKKHSLEFLREKAHLRFRTNTFSAVFKLTPGDEEAYSISQSKKILKKRLVKLLPSLQPGSSFLDYVEKGLLSIDDIDNCYFLIQTSVKHSQEEPAKDVKFKLKILKTDSSVNTETKKHPEIKATPEEPSQTVITITKQKVLKIRLKDKSHLTGLIHDFLGTLGTNTGDPKPFGSIDAWEGLMLHYENKKGLIASKADDERSFF